MVTNQSRSNERKQKIHNIDNLVTESEGSTGKYPTKVLLYSLLRGQYSKTEVGYFPVLPERSLRSVSFLLYGIQISGNMIGWIGNILS
jgi:hypothetical protein